MPEFSNHVVGLFKRAAKEQGGLLSGKDPTEFNPDDPIRLWIVQVGVIVSTASLLSLGLRKLRQPKVIAEVLGGIILGPTAFGRIPGFTEHIFPSESMPYLSLVANIGLCLFLFLVGLEIEGGVVKRNARLSAAIGLAGMIIPFGLGAGLAVPIYKQFIDQDVEFTHFMLFAGVAFSITAFPVLCRILTELKLLDTTVGIVVLSAGVANDIIGWTLLALSVALVNGGGGLSALYILLVCVGFALILLFPGRMALHWLARKTGSIENGPTIFFMTITILLLFGSAFFTDIIGVHAIFGAFLTGLIVPREGNMAIHLTEKLEDMVQIIFLPLYFTLSGLSTDLGLLNDGMTWGYTIAICTLAFVGKFGGCMLAARYAAGFSWRESSAIGSLMSCKGLVELIVLNVGLSAGILSQRVFSMFVLEALVLTFATTPLVTSFYPAHLRVRAAATGANFDNVNDGDREGRPSQVKSLGGDGLSKRRFTFVLDKLEHVPGMMAIVQLIQPSVVDNSEKAKGTLLGSVEALRLIELSDRTSAVMMSSHADELLHTDPLLGVFKMFGQLNDLIINTVLAIVPYDDLHHRVVDQARNSGSELVVLPWLPLYSDVHADPALESTTPRAQMGNPFDAFFKSTSTSDRSPSAIHAQFVRGVFAHSATDVALFVDLAGPSMTAGKQHIVLPFFGGPDERLALDFVAQLCENPRVTATVLRLSKEDVDPGLTSAASVHLGDEKAGDVNQAANMLTVASAAGAHDTYYGYYTTETRMQSETADNIAWAKYASPAATSTFPTAAARLRMEFKEVASPIPLRAAIGIIGDLQQEKAAEGRRLLVVAGRSRRLAVENHKAELKELVEEYGGVPAEVSKTIGDVGTACVMAKAGTGVIVLQTSTKTE